MVEHEYGVAQSLAASVDKMPKRKYGAWIGTRQIKSIKEH